MLPSSDVMQIYQAIRRSTASRRGVSYWETPNLCGKKLQLIEQHREMMEAEEISDELRVGTFYHALQDMWRKGAIPEGTVLDGGDIQDMEWTEAVRLFKWYRAQWDIGFWGDIVASEQPLPASPEHRQRIVDFFGHDEITGAVDLIVNMSAADVTRVELEKGITLRGPGVYFIDYKTSGARVDEAKAPVKYTSTMQSMTYPVLWNLAGGAECKGMIFDVIVKHATLRRVPDKKAGASWQAFFAPAQPEHAEIVKNTITIARERKLDGRANAYACTMGFNPCVFWQKGICRRY